jgi:hypothetical protein
MSVLALTTGDFWDRIDHICKVVDAQVKAKDTDLLALPLTVQRTLETDKVLPPTLIEDLLDFVEALQEIRVLQQGEHADPGKRWESKFRAPPSTSWINKFGLWLGFDTISENPDMDALLRVCRDKLRKSKGKVVDATELDRRGDEVLMEYLTAAWLALYFLGMPFIHPWEQVRRMGDARGGFPSGGCIAKYAGDVYRYERQRRKQDRGARPESSMLVLSHVPYVLLPGLINCPDGDDLTPPNVHVLGRLYAALQMRLYFDLEYPAKFFIPIDSIGRALQRLVEADQRRVKAEGRHEKPRSRDAFIKEIAPWLATLFHKGGGKQSVTLLSRSSLTAGLPSCILGTRVGIYSLDSGNSGLHFSGNQLHDALLESYRTTLDKLGGQSGGNLLDLLAEGNEAVATKVTALIDEEHRASAGASP